MAQWSVRINNVIKNRTSLTIDYDVLKDDVVFESASITVEGDSIDIGAIRARMLKMLQRLKGVDEKADTVDAQKARIFDLVGNNLVLRQ